MNIYLFGALAVTIAAACSQGEQGVSQMQAGDPVIALSEGTCPITCPVYDMTLHADGSYILNGERFVRTVGISEGNLGEEAWTAAVRALEESGFWSLKPVQTADTLATCHPDAPTAKVTWRNNDGKEKTVTYNAGCGVQKMQTLVSSLREAMHFSELVFTEDRFDPRGNR